MEEEKKRKNRKDGKLTEKGNMILEKKFEQKKQKKEKEGRMERKKWMKVRDKERIRNLKGKRYNVK